jgi:hypothetical protein
MFTSLPGSVLSKKSSSCFSKTLLVSNCNRENSQHLSYTFHYLHKVDVFCIVHEWIFLKFFQKCYILLLQMGYSTLCVLHFLGNFSIINDLATADNKQRYAQFMCKMIIRVACDCYKGSENTDDCRAMIHSSKLRTVCHMLYKTCSEDILRACNVKILCPRIAFFLMFGYNIMEKAWSFWEKNIIFCEKLKI